MNMKRDELRKAYVNEVDTKVRARILMVLLLEEGESPTAVGTRFFCPHSEVLYWRERFKKEGIAGLKTKTTKH